jgi:hypothetical protein
VRVLVATTTVVAVVGLVAGPSLSRFGRRAGVVSMAAVAIGLLGGPAAYALQTVSTAHTGSIPSAGPTVAGASGGPGGGLGLRARTGGPAGGQGLFGPGAGTGSPGTPPQGGAARGTGLPEGGPPAGTAGGSVGSGTVGGFPGARSAGGAGIGALGAGGGGSASVGSALVTALESNTSSYRWVAATMGSTNAATYELATGGEPVMAIGGFNNNGGLLSLAQFIRYVKAGDIHYYIASGGGGGAGGPNGGTSSSTTSEISSWVASHYSAETIGGVTVYDLTK